MDLSDIIKFDVKPVANKGLYRLLMRKITGGTSTNVPLDAVQLTALRAAQILNSSTPRLRNPTILVFAADHGVANPLAHLLQDEAPTENTLLSFLNGTAAVNVLARAARLDVKVIDLGVNHSFEGTLTYWLHHGTKFINRKQAFGSRDFMEFPAITSAELASSMKVGADMVDRERKSGCNTLGLGEMGKGGRLVAAALAATLLDEPIDKLLPNENPEITTYLDKAIKSHPKTHEVYTLLSLFGGFDMAAMVAAIVRAAHHRMIVLIDNSYGCVAALAASKIEASVLSYCMFTHQSTGSLHRLLLQRLQAKPLAVLNYKAHSGSGVAYTFPMLSAAVDLLASSQPR